MRARRGSLESKHENGRLYVWLDDDETSVKGAAERELIEELREQVSFLRAQLIEEREENRRKDHLLAAALERIPQIEPPQNASPDERESPPSASDAPDNDDVPPEQERRSWWQRWFGS
jgi:hypothetical protein